MMSEAYSQQLITDFKRDGFVAMKGFLNTEEIQNVHQNLAHFKQDILPTLPREHLFYEDLNDADSLKQIQKVQMYDDYFGQLFDGIGTRLQLLPVRKSFSPCQ